MNKSCYLHAIQLLTKKDYSEYKLRQKLITKFQKKSSKEIRREYLIQTNEEFSSDQEEVPENVIKLSDAEIDEVIQYLIDKRFLQEESYAEARVVGLLRKGLSPSAIKQRLSNEHVEVDMNFIMNLFAEHQTSIDSQIDELITKKIKVTYNANKDTQKLKEKVHRYLLGKGHCADEFSHILQQKIEELSL